MLQGDSNVSVLKTSAFILKTTLILFLHTEDYLDFVASVFEHMPADQKGNFFAKHSELAVKVVGRRDKERPAGTVSISDGGRSLSDLSAITDDETSEMHVLYANVTYQDSFNKHIWRSIVVCLKDRIFPKIKFWKESKACFHVPDFRTLLPNNKYEQSRKVCEMLMDFVVKEMCIRCERRWHFGSCMRH